MRLGYRAVAALCGTALVAALGACGSGEEAGGGQYWSMWERANRRQATPAGPWHRTTLTT